MTTSRRANAAVKTIGFGHAPEHERHHFVVAIPRAQMGDVMIYEVFERDLIGPELIAANLRCNLDRNRWLKVVDALEEEFNQRLRTARMKATHFKAGDNSVARLLGKELLLLVWAIEDADPSLIPNAIQNWRGLVPEERWWLYTMTAAQTAHYAKHNVGWRRAIRHALTENPVVMATPQLTAAEYRRRSKLPNRDAEQGGLFDGLEEAEAASPVVGHGIWEEA